MYKIFRVRTVWGYLYLKREYEIINNIEMPKDKLIDCFTGLECSIYYNYLKFFDGRKCLRFGDLSFKDGVISTREYSLKELNEDEFNTLSDNMDEWKINKQKYSLDIINNGIPLNEVDELINDEYLAANKKEKVADLSDPIVRFNLMFKDLFEDQNKRTR